MKIFHDQIVSCICTIKVFKKNNSSASVEYVIPKKLCGIINIEH